MGYTLFVYVQDARYPILSRQEEIHTYRPYAAVRIVVGIALLVFVAMLLIAIKTEQKMFYVAVSAFMTVCAVIALVETFVARVDVEPKIVVVKGLIRTERIELSQVEKVSAEGGRIGLFMKPTKKWKKLPEWLGGNMSARRRIADRLTR